VLSIQSAKRLLRGESAEKRDRAFEGFQAEIRERYRRFQLGRDRESIRQGRFQLEKIPARQR
jgi:hypothetical protein